MISRRSFLAGAAAACVGAPATASDDAVTLGAAAAKAGLIYGASIGDEAFADPAYMALYKREASIFTTEVALKFDWLRPDADTFDFSRADAIVAAAEASNKRVRGHTLIWNDNAPQWLKRLSGREVERVFDRHIETVVQRYAGRLHSWDIVNEPFWPMARIDGGWRNGPWFAAMGPSYVGRAFRRAAAIDKTARLTLNEAQCENDHEWGRSIRPPFAALVERMLDAGVPLHAVGFQGHLQPQWPSNYAAFAEYVGDFGRKGLDVYITEFDVNDQAFPDDIATRDAAVAATGARFLDAVLKQPAVKMIVNWQLSDRYSWYRAIWRKNAPQSPRPPRPLPFTDDNQGSPLRDAMLASLRARQPS